MSSRILPLEIIPGNNAANIHLREAVKTNINVRDLRSLGQMLREVLIGKTRIPENVEWIGFYTVEMTTTRLLLRVPNPPTVVLALIASYGENQSILTHLLPQEASLIVFDSSPGLG
jgi:hypothetical protein